MGNFPEGIGAVGMLINFTVAFIVSKFTPEPPKEVQELIENIRLPSGAGKATHH